MNEKTPTYGSQIAAAALKINAVTLKTRDYYTWAKGWQSPVYNDNRRHLSYPGNRKLIVDAMCAKIKEKEIPFDGILATTSSGIPWGTLLADRLKVPVFILSEGEAYTFPYPENVTHQWTADMVASGSPFGLPLGIRVANITELPFIYVRPEQKGHGLRNKIEGHFETGKSVCYVTMSDDLSNTNVEELKEAGLSVAVQYVVSSSFACRADIKGLRLLSIEDLISTGGSCLKEAKECRDLGATCDHVITVFDYGFPIAREKAAEAGVTIHSLSTYDNILEAAVEINYISEDHLALLKTWREDPELWSDMNGGTNFKAQKETA